MRWTRVIASQDGLHPSGLPVCAHAHIASCGPYLTIIARNTTWVCFPATLVSIFTGIFDIFKKLTAGGSRHLLNAFTGLFCNLHLCIFQSNLFLSDSSSVKKKKNSINFRDK